jgi:hypothetical protein
MEKWNEIRHRVLVEGASKRLVRREYGIGWETLNKILANPEPSGYRRQTDRPKSKLGPFVGIVDAIIAEDRDAPPKQRHTARRIFERLRDEHGYVGARSPSAVTSASTGGSRARSSCRSVSRPERPSSTSARRPSRSPASG